MNISQTIFLCVVAFIKIIPNIRGRGRLINFINQLFVFKFGVDPHRVIKLRNGTIMKVDLRSGSEFRPYYEGAYHANQMSFIHKIFDTDTIFLDVGANIGFYSIAIAKKIFSTKGQGLVIAFEPFVNNFQRLKFNVRLNGLTKICIIKNHGLSDSNRTEYLTLREDFKGGAITGNAAIITNTSIDENFERVVISLKRLDSCLDEVKTLNKKISFIKVDIEGHEDFFLRGASCVIHSHRPIIFMEINRPYYVARGIEDLNSLFVPLLPTGYLCYRYKGGVFKKINNLIECDAIDDVYWIPKESLGLLAVYL